MLSLVTRRASTQAATINSFVVARRARYSSLRGKVIAVSGAASGIGLMTARLLYPMGVKLSLTDVNKDALDDAVAHLEASTSPSTIANTSDVMAMGADVRSSSEVSQWIQNTIEKYGTLDGAANFAGILGDFAPLVETSDEDWMKIQNVNLNGTFFAVRAQLKAMIKGGGGGSIVNTASIAGVRAGFGGAAYTMSKHGVIGLTKTAAKEVGRMGIRVNAVAPGAIDTPMSRNAPQEILAHKHLIDSITPLGRQGKAEEVAKLVAFLLSDESSFTTGAVHVIDGGLTT